MSVQFLRLAIIVLTTFTQDNSATFFSKPTSSSAHFRPHQPHSAFPPGWSPSVQYPNQLSGPILVQVPHKSQFVPGSHHFYVPKPSVTTTRRPSSHHKPKQPNYKQHHYHTTTHATTTTTARPSPDVEGSDPQLLDDEIREDGPLPPRDYFPPPDIIEILEDEGATTMLSLLEQVDLLERLKRRGDYTLLAPTNDAFSKLDRTTIDTFTNDLGLLKDVLEYHIVPRGKIFSKIIKDDLLTETLHENKTIRFNVVDGEPLVITVNGAEVDNDLVDQRASNGVVHFINDVMYPIPVGNAFEVLENDNRFVTLVRAIEIADLVETLEDSGPFTLFAPTDEAFEKIPSEALDELLSDKEALQQLLLNHLVAGTKLSRSLTFVDLDTLGNKVIGVRTSKGRVQVDGANLVDGDIVATNGAIQVIDKVLL